MVGQGKKKGGTSVQTEKVGGGGKERKRLENNELWRSALIKKDGNKAEKNFKKELGELFYWCLGGERRGQKGSGDGRAEGN